MPGGKPGISGILWGWSGPGWLRLAQGRAGLSAGRRQLFAYGEPSLSPPQQPCTSQITVPDLSECLGLNTTSAAALSLIEPTHSSSSHAFASAASLYARKPHRLSGPHPAEAVERQTLVFVLF